jgi:hypothetical protein
MNFTRPRFGNSSQPLLGRDFLRVTAVLDFPSAAAAAGNNLTVSVPGAAVGDDVIIGFLAAPSPGLIFSGWVSAVDTVTVRAQNPTAGALDAASASYRVIVLKN